MFQFPGSDLDRAGTVLGLLGSCWNRYWGQGEVGGESLVRAYATALQRLAAQAADDLKEGQRAASRLLVDIWHDEHWYLLRLKESDLNSVDSALPQFGEGYVYGDGGIRYGTPVQRPYSRWEVPADLKACRLVMNRMSAPSVVMTESIDFQLGDGDITFVQNPFDNPAIPKRSIFTGSVVTDREIGLWVFRGQFDWERIYQQFGYVLQLRLASDESYRDLLNGLLSSIVRGSNLADLQTALAAITNTPLTLEPEETVEQVYDDGEHLLVLTDLTAYKFNRGATALVEVGDVVQAGDPLVDTLQLHEFNTGELADWMTSAAFGDGFLSHGFLGELGFDNRAVPLIAEVVDGYTKLSWELGGFSGDVEAFWDRIHTDGIAAGQTLAQLLDPRETPVGDPSPAVFPATINPLLFLAQHVLRHHAFAVLIKVSQVGRQALSLSLVRLLRRIIPPHTAMLIFLELFAPDEQIILDGQAGTEEQPGSTESGLLGLGAIYEETLDPTTGLITEQVSFGHVGHCV